jgi:hypothetical protein
MYQCMTQVIRVSLELVLVNSSDSIFARQFILKMNGNKFSSIQNFSFRNLYKISKMCIVGHTNILRNNSSFSKVTYFECNAVGIHGFD